MDRESFITMMTQAKLHDLTQACSVFTPPWPGEKSLEVHFFKRVTGAYGGGQGANGQILNWSNTVGTHLVGERAFHSGGRARGLATTPPIPWRFWQPTAPVPSISGSQKWSAVARRRAIGRRSLPGWLAPRRRSSACWRTRRGSLGKSS
jgi:hypothetical protein